MCGNTLISIVNPVMCESNDNHSQYLDNLHAQFYFTFFFLSLTNGLFCQTFVNEPWKQNLKFRTTYSHGNGIETVLHIDSGSVMMNGIGEFFPDLKTLVVRGFSKILSLERRHFNHMQNLKKLVLNEINCIAEDAFEHLSNLESLWIYWTEDFGSEKMFQNFKKLNELFIKRFSSHVLPETVLRCLESLTTLTIEQFEHQKVDRNAFANLHELRQLTIRSSEIEMISEDAFKDCTSLELLALKDSKKLEIINEKVFWNLLELKTLSLYYTNLKSIPLQTFRDQTNLEELDLSGTKIEFFLENLFKPLKNLKVLKLYWTPIMSLHENVFNSMIHLKELNMGGCKVQTLSAHLFDNNLELEKISFPFNRLKKIDVDFTRLAKLKRLELSNNVCIDKTYLHDKKETSTTLKEFQKTIRFKCSQL